jgi:hypothetical protein
MVATIAEIMEMSSETPPLELYEGFWEWQIKRIMEDLESLHNEESANFCPRSWKANEKVKVCKIHERDNT